LFVVCLLVAPQRARALRRSDVKAGPPKFVARSLAISLATFVLNFLELEKPSANAHNATLRLEKYLRVEIPASQDVPCSAISEMIVVRI
jgi:hypothetical protein